MIKISMKIKMLVDLSIHPSILGANNLEQNVNFLFSLLGFPPQKLTPGNCEHIWKNTEKKRKACVKCVSMRQIAANLKLPETCFLVWFVQFVFQLWEHTSTAFISPFYFMCDSDRAYKIQRFLFLPYDLEAQGKRKKNDNVGGRGKKR